MDEIVFSNEAYNAIIEESFAFDPDETGGILLGHKSNEVWFVMKMIPSGFNENKVHHSRALFKYDKDYVNYTMEKVSQNYAVPLEVLGLWHRHPDGYEQFSSTDDRTNFDFATKYCRFGHLAISGLVHVDPRFRLNMYLVDARVSSLYKPLDFYVGDYLIPEEYLELKHIRINNEEIAAELNPMGPRGRRPAFEKPITGECNQPEEGVNPDINTDTIPGVTIGTKREAVTPLSEGDGENGPVLSIQRNLDSVMLPPDQTGTREKTASENEENIQEELKSILHGIPDLIKKNGKTILFLFLLLLCFFSYKPLYSYLADIFQEKEAPTRSLYSAPKAGKATLTLILPGPTSEINWKKLDIEGLYLVKSTKEYIIVEYSGKDNRKEAMEYVSKRLDEFYKNKTNERNQ